MYRVIKDTREQQGWWFPEEGDCAGTVVAKLDSGDYSIEGLEKIFTIERKRNTGEFAMNMFEVRFKAELQRLEEYRHSFLILEFSYDDLLRFPVNSGIPKGRWNKLRATPNLLKAYLNNIDLKYKTKIIFAPGGGQDRAETLFKYVSRMYESK